MTLILTTALLLPQLSTGAPSKGAVTAVKQFAKAADTQNVKQLQTLLHDDFRVSFVVKGTDTASQMTKADYLGLAKAGKLGGDTRTVEVLGVDVQGPLAFVRVRLTGKKASFESMQTVLHTSQGWKVLGDSVLFAPKG